MKVVQSVHAKYHHFDLARQLHRQGILEAIFTGYPRWKLKDSGLPPEKIKTFPWLRTILMAQYRYGLVNPWLDRELNWIAGQCLDAHVAAHLPECDVFVGISGAGLKTSRRVKARGGRYICDRGSAHIRFCQRILREEFKRWGQMMPEIDARAVAKEEREYAEADVISVPSRFSARSFVEMGVPPGKLRVIPYGVDLRHFSKCADPSPDRFEVLFVGGASFQKGVPYLLAAFEQLKHPGKRLRFIGGVLDEMKVFMRNKNANNVEFVGPVPQAELSSIMSKSHVLVLPSVQDGFGMVLGQAMACGCPVICSTNSAGEDIVENGKEGFVVPIRDPEAITARLEQLCQDRDLRDAMANAAIKRVTELGGWDDYGARFGHLCRELAGLTGSENRLSLNPGI
jgi:starch synthase